MAASNPAEPPVKLLCPPSRSAAVSSCLGPFVRFLDGHAHAHSSSYDRVLLVSPNPNPADGSDHHLASLLRVFEAMVGSSSPSGEVGCRMLVPSDWAGDGDLQRMREESGASLSLDSLNLPPGASPGEEVLQMSGDFSSVRKALVSIYRNLQRNPRADPSNSGANAPKLTVEIPCTNSSPTDHFPRQDRPSGSRHPDPCPWGPPPFQGQEVMGPNRRMIAEEEIVFKLLCLREKVGSLIGKGGCVVNAIQHETGAFIKILDISPDSEEKIVVISARENSEQMRSSAQEAVMRVHQRITEIGFDPGTPAIARLFLPSQQIRSLLGKGGFKLNDVRRATGTNIRIFHREQSPRFDGRYHEVVQIVGNVSSVEEALFRITGRIRQIILPIRPPHSGFGSPPYFPPFNDMPPPFPRPRHNPHSPGHYPSPGAIPHDINRPLPPPHNSFDYQPSFPHGFDPALPPREQNYHPYDGERPGFGPPPPHPFDIPPSPRMWTPQNMGGVNAGGAADFGPNMASGNWPPGGGNQGQNMAVTSVEMTIPQIYVEHVHGENDINLSDIRQITGAKVEIQDPRHGVPEGIVMLSGTTSQVRAAQSLIHAFIMCGQAY
ncbi:hypothetical protein MLD38_029366 [Melastoma candidum]|uniref:Uncharacterized protein n=1 Tax=Melastoma candidum TaxID=119954 RepID=A0ACB9N5D0_9MYRT|nr:hypothetical protein MLD38_029366 [Melastoma candidum]